VRSRLMVQPYQDRAELFMIHNPCIFCGHANNSVTVIQENGYLGKKCSPCNLIYISPRPSLEQINNLYGHDQAHISASAHIAQAYPKRIHAQHTLSILKKHLSGGDLLELGSGAGYFLMQAKLQGFNPHGIELNPIQSAFIQNSLKIPCEAKPLDSDSFGTKKFDVIYHSDVLSHFYDPFQAMQAMHEKLKPNGYIIFETGNIADIDPKYYTSFNAMQYPDHLFFFGRKSITQLLNIHDFELLKYYSYSIVPQLKIMQLVKSLKQRFTQTPRVNTGPLKKSQESHQSVAKNTLRIVYHTLMHRLRYTIGAHLSQEDKPQTVIVVAQKKCA
jgi:2-polyprenyl-3-methyl-5-hydroxy-6-metoxy-1,4-benzoquinol methylase